MLTLALRAQLYFADPSRVLAHSSGSVAATCRAVVHIRERELVL
jgi:hypothetical protein